MNIGKERRTTYIEPEPLPERLPKREPNEPSAPEPTNPEREPEPVPAK